MSKTNFATLTAILSAALLTGCGGGGDFISAGHAQSITQTVYQLHGIARPDGNGRWFIQNDIDHAPSGIVGLVQTGEYIEIRFDRRYSHAGTIQVTMDDDFNGFCTAGANLGLSAAQISIKCNGTRIDPANIYSYGPRVGSGNIWINVTMVQRSAGGVE